MTDNTPYTFNNIINDHNIVIPLIQRDYAQGRKSEKDKAKSFLQAIHKGLKKENGITLDFIYGKVEIQEKDPKSAFIPLDGQQRLTTLFLLHWYACFDLNEKDGELKKLSNFTYKVRDTTTDFLAELTNKENLEKLHKSDQNKLSKQIQNCNCFFNSWNNDPSIKAMLYMLDLIHVEFNGEEKLLANLDKINFKFLDLKEFKLTDELYVKMNARGTPLTNFENFKSLFDKKTTTDNINKFDGKFFTCFKNLTITEEEGIKQLEIVNNNFYSFISHISLGMYWSQIKKIQVEKDDEKTQGAKINAWDLLKGDHYNDLYTKDENVNDLISFLDYLSCINKDTESTYVDCSIINSYITETIQEVIKNNLGPENRSKFYAIYIGVLKYPANEDRKKLQDWIRVTFNLINNQLDINFYELVQSFNDLIKYDNLYCHISKKNEFVEKFNKIQCKEEHIKAKIILENPNIEEAIIIAEKIPYLKGRIGFLLYDENDKYLEDTFTKHRDIFERLWNFSAKKDDSQNNQNLIRGALLTLKDYLPKIKSKYTFCSFRNDLQSKDGGWRKVFDDSNEEFKSILDKLVNKDINQVLIDMIQEYVSKEEKDWRYYVLKTFYKDDKYKSDFMIYTHDRQDRHCILKHENGVTTSKLSVSQNSTQSLNVHESILRVRLKQEGFDVDSNSNEYTLYVTKGDQRKKISYDNFSEHALFTISDDHEGDKKKSNRSAEGIIEYLKK